MLALIKEANRFINVKQKKKQFQHKKRYMANRLQLLFFGCSTYINLIHENISSLCQIGHLVMT